MKREQLAINSVSTRQTDLEVALTAYAAAGFGNVEFHLPLVKSWLSAGHTVDDACRLLAAHDLHSIGGFEAPVECFTGAESKRANHALIEANAKLIHNLGGGTLVVGTDGPVPPADDSLAALETIAATLRSIAARIDGLDVVIALEFNWSPIVRSLQSAVRVAELVAHPQIGVLFDPAHYYVTPTKREDLTPAAVAWIRHVHLDDMSDKPGDLSHCNDDRVLPGHGVLDLPALIETLERHGYDGYFSIEMFNAALWQLPASDAARRCFESLLPLCKE